MNKTIVTLLLSIALFGCSSTPKEYQVLEGTQVCEDYGMPQEYCEESQEDESNQELIELLGAGTAIGISIISVISNI